MALLCVLVAAILVCALSVLYALRKGYNVKTAFKLPLIAFTFEANDQRTARRRKDAPDKAAGSRSVLGLAPPGKAGS